MTIQKRKCEWNKTHRIVATGTKDSALLVYMYHTIQKCP